MLQDINKKDVKDGDIIVVSYKSYPHMDIGVLVDGKVRTLSTINSAKPIRACYLQEEPTQEELDLKEKILELIEDNKKKKKQRQKELSKEKGTLLGGIYSTNEGNTYIYLGKIREDVYDDTGTLIQSQEGNCYYQCSWSDVRDGTDKITKDTVFVERGIWYRQFLKGFKNVSGLAGVHPVFSRKDYSGVVGTYNFVQKDYYSNTTKTYKRVITKLP